MEGCSLIELYYQKVFQRKDTRITHYDMQGKEVVRLREADMPAGYHVLDWDGRSTAGAAVGSGTYIVKVSFEGDNGLREEGTQQILLVK